DPADRRVAGETEPGTAAGAERLDRIVDAAGRLRDPLGDVGLDLVEHGLEQRLLAVEVMVQRAPADAGFAEHGGDRGSLVAVRDEEPRRDRHQLPARRLPLLDLPAHLPLDIPTVGL